TPQDTRGAPARLQLTGSRRTCSRSSSWSRILRPDGRHRLARRSRTVPWGRSGNPYTMMSAPFLDASTVGDDDPSTATGLPVESSKETVPVGPSPSCVPIARKEPPAQPEACLPTMGLNVVWPGLVFTQAQGGKSPPVNGKAWPGFTRRLVAARTPSAPPRTPAPGTKVASLWGVPGDDPTEQSCARVPGRGVRPLRRGQAERMSPADGRSVGQLPVVDGRSSERSVATPE